MKTYEDGVRACIAALRDEQVAASVAASRLGPGEDPGHRLSTRSIELLRAIQRLERLLAEATPDALTQLRAAGWMVAVHNDYRLDGKSMTFWLLTHTDGRYVKGEGETDGQALRLALAEATPDKPDKPVGPPFTDDGPDCRDGVHVPGCRQHNPAEPPVSPSDIQELAAQVRADVRAATVEAEEMGRRLDEQSRRRAEAGHKPVEPPVCKDWCGKGDLPDRIPDDRYMPENYKRGDPSYCSPACRALGRPANPRKP